jgi:multidrug efflux pump subunit AcrB
MSAIALETPGVEHAVAFPGLNIASFSNSPNSGLVFFALKPFEEREGPGMSGPEITASLMKKFQSIQEANVAVFPPPPVRGLSTTGGFKLMLEDRADLGYEDLYSASQALLGRLFQTQGMAFAYTNYQINVPQLYADIDRVKAKQQGIVLNDLFETMQTYLGSTYVNDFNRFGRTYRVIAQADAPFRDEPDDIAQLRTRNQAGEMVPLGAVVTVHQSYGPDRVQHYNGYKAADINGVTLRASRPATSSPRSRRQRTRCCQTASASSGPRSATCRSSPATPPSSSSRSASCSSSSCSRPSTRAGRCRSPSSSSSR